MIWKQSFSVLLYDEAILTARLDRMRRIMLLWVSGCAELQEKNRAPENILLKNKVNTRVLRLSLFKCNVLQITSVLLLLLLYPGHEWALLCQRLNQGEGNWRKGQFLLQSWTCAMCLHNSAGKMQPLSGQVVLRSWLSLAMFLSC